MKGGQPVDSAKSVFDWVTMDLFGLQPRGVPGCCNRNATPLLVTVLLGLVYFPTHPLGFDDR